MASPPRPSEREEERRLNLRTLVVASVASATAALVVSQLWIAGTWIAAAMTPVIVAFVSELLHRPTERIARGLTTDREALSTAEPVRDRPRGTAPDEPPVRFYRAGEGEPQAPPRTPGRRRRIAWAAVATTAALALAIAVFVITVPELVAGGSISKRDGGSTFFPPGKSRKSKAEPTQTTTTPSQSTTTGTQTTPPPTTPETTPQTTTPPTQSTPAPQSTPTGPAPAAPQQ
jgi:hypothetical protein